MKKSFNELSKEEIVSKLQAIQGILDGAMVVYNVKQTGLDSALTTMHVQTDYAVVTGGSYIEGGIDLMNLGGDGGKK
jgi:hypothetical protein